MLSKTLFTLSVDEKMKVTMVAEIPNTTPVNVIKNSAMVGHETREGIVSGGFFVQTLF